MTAKDDILIINANHNFYNSSVVLLIYPKLVICDNINLS